MKNIINNYSKFNKKKVGDKLFGTHVNDGYLIVAYQIITPEAQLQTTSFLIKTTPRSHRVQIQTQPSHPNLRSSLSLFHFPIPLLR